MRYYDSTIKIRLDRETINELKKMSLDRKEKVSSIIRRLIYKELKEWRKKKKQTVNPPNLSG
jgi:uncharacterized protein YdaU (DUF1376 family)